MEVSGSWVRFGIKLLATMVLLGHMMMWIMMPTKTFLQDWLSAIHAVVSPTYYGKFGANTLLYTFPVMFIATLGCVYLHLGTKTHEHTIKRGKRKNSFLDSWKRPALVKGPLGIVSWIELMLLTMFVVLLVWFFYSLHKTFSGNEAEDAAKKGIPLWKVTVSNAGFVFGLVGHVCLSFLFFPVSRGSSVLQLFGLTSESSIKYHIWLGHIAMLVLTAHGFFSFAGWASLSEMLKWDTIHISNVAGEISLLAGIIMWATSLPIVRRKFFEVFFYSHYLYIVFMIFYIFHVGFPYACITIGGFFLFLIDRYIRFLQSKQRVQLVSARILACHVMELNFKKSTRLDYSPTSVLFVNVPGISKLQWHPFTVSSGSDLDSEVVSVVIKSEGVWSKKLYKRLVELPLERVEVALEGPYGPASTHFLSYDTLVLVSGGSGITPYISIIRHLLYISTNTNLKTPKILLICAFKTSQDLAMLHLILPSPHSKTTPFHPSSLDIQVQAYVTRDKCAISNDQKQVQTLLFKPDPRDSALAPVLGASNWLWLGTVVVSSFVMFLVLVAVVTQCYIYPIDRNTDEVFNNTWRAAIYMVLMCGSIVVSSSAVFLWNKRENEKEMGKTTSSEGVDRELESLPQQSLWEVTNVTYGSRPNLKKMILDVEESSVGVFASGPKKLRQEVAKICASGLGDNLHFESISFSCVRKRQKLGEMGLGFMKEPVLCTIKLLVVLVCLGHVMTWIVMPTKTFLDHWLPSITARIHPTYFGNLGKNALLYTFPVMFIATMACLYLHIRGKVDKGSAKRNKVLKSSWVDSWKRPALVRGLLGIVSWIELAFFAMFLALLVWFFYSFVNYYSSYAALYAANKGIKVWQEMSFIVAFVLGIVGNVCMAFLFFPVTRASSVLLLFGLTSESAIKYHIWIGHITMILFTAHGVVYIFTWAVTNRLYEMLEWDRIWISNVAGEISLLAGLVMWVTCLPRIRRKIFVLFFYTHYLYIIFMIFYVFHVGFPYICTSIAGFFVFLIDRYIRFLQSQQRIQLVSARVLPCQVLELNFSKSMRLSYNPTSVLFVNVPSISKLQWHPYTISSSSNLDTEIVSIVVKKEGTWSGNLYDKFLSACSSPVDRVEIALEGPYGPSSTDYLRHDMLVLVSGGSGITSFISIIREILFIASTTNIKTPRILLLCAFKYSQDLAMLDLILPESVSGASLNVSTLRLQIEAYVTREKDPISDEKKLTRTLWFKPNALDSPLAPVLGPNSWLWLGCVISSSFVVFLLLVGVFTQYYIYPVDHNTDEHYSNVARAAFYMLFMCASIVLTSSAVVLWNKKKNRENMKQIQSISESSDGDRELESLPRQTLSQATNVSYGTRPNLKKILLEIEESSVRVLASGPRKLRQDVAEICSSGVVDNLHFESISFSW